MILCFIFAVIMMVLPIETCKILKSKPFTCEQILGSLKYHNEMRNKVALGKTKLAEDVGENIGFKANSAKNAKSLSDYVSMMEMWYNEIDDYDESGNHKGVVGHFTQLVWGSTMYVGCGMTLYEDPNDSKHPYHSLLVCDYKPGGNFKDTKPYDEYDGPDKCDKGVLSQIYKGLCAHDAEHAKLGDTCSSSQGFRESVSVMLVSSAIVWCSIFL
nr:CRISP/Allergen/PR-1-like isoform X4 [Halyomorpha halys]